MNSIKRLIFWWLLPIVSGLLLSFSFPLFEQSYLIWIALVPLFIFFELIRRSEYVKHKTILALFGSFTTGLIFFGINLRWFFYALPFNWDGASVSRESFVIITIIWLITIVLMSFLTALFGWLTYKIGFSFKKGFLVAGSWSVLEYLRSWIFILPWLGPEAYLGPHWNFANLAYTLHQSGYFLKLAPWLGAYGIGFLIVLVNWNIFLLLTLQRSFSQFKRWLASGLVLVFIFIGPFFLGWPAVNVVGEKKVALLQTNFPALVSYISVKTEPIQTQLIRTALKENPEIIILPEGSEWLSSLTDNFATSSLIEATYKILGSYPYLVIDHERISTEEGFKSRLIYYLNSQGIVGQYDKELLVPGGEYLPYSMRILGEVFGEKDIVESFALKRGYSPGHKPGLVEAAGTKIGGSICSGTISPEVNRKLTQAGAQVLLSVSSDAVFNGSLLLLKQNLATAQLRAAENQRYFLQSSNRGLSYIISEKGQVEKITSGLGNTVIISQIKLIETESFYTHFGDWLVWVSLILLFIYGIVRKIKSRPVPSLEINVKP
jgi:apolipoprotein N-acyltransferase